MRFDRQQPPVANKSNTGGGKLHPAIGEIP